jgi:hypothetical protein
LETFVKKVGVCISIDFLEESIQEFFITHGFRENAQPDLRPIPPPVCRVRIISIAMACKSLLARILAGQERY